MVDYLYPLKKDVEVSYNNQAERDLLMVKVQQKIAGTLLLLTAALESWPSAWLVIAATFSSTREEICYDGLESRVPMRA